MSPALEPLESTYAETAGERPTTGGASQARLLPTPIGDFLCKFPRSEGESRRGPANEHLGNSMMEALGADRPRRVLVRLPDAVRASDPTFGTVVGDVGLGIARLAGAVDVASSTVDAAANTPDAEVLAQVLVLRWLQNNDHNATGNWMVQEGRLVAVDLAATPADEVWSGAASISDEVLNHGDLDARIAAMPQEVKAELRAKVERLTQTDFMDILNLTPTDWATRAEKEGLAAELERRKEAVLDGIS